VATPHTPSPAAKRAIRKIGADLKTARLRQRLPMEIVANRAFISRGTLARVEAGDPGVSFGLFATVMQALRLDGQLADVAADDRVGVMMENERLPQRVRIKRKPDS